MAQIISLDLRALVETIDGLNALAEEQGVEFRGAILTGRGERVEVYYDDELNTHA
jgi:hypothetical protein